VTSPVAAPPQRRRSGRWSATHRSSRLNGIERTTHEGHCCRGADRRIFHGAGHGGPIDLSAQTCKQFQASSPDEIKIILAWLDGYYKDEKDPPVIDTDKFVANAKKLGEYCSANPTIGLITATDKLFGDGK
jgi:acid stress chaperone HdeB